MPSLISSKVNKGDTYSLVVGCIYVFNMMLGTGALTMPYVFAKAGWVMGLAVITLLCAIAYVQLTFLIEALANANFAAQMDSRAEKAKKEREVTTGKTNLDSLLPVKELNPKEQTSGTNSEPSTVLAIEKAPKQSETTTNEAMQTSSEPAPAKPEALDFRKYFAINDKFEIGNMTEYFLYPWMSSLFFVTILAYMYGDLVIYNTMMIKSLRDVLCTGEFSCDKKIALRQRCWGNMEMTRANAYRIFLVALMTVLIPLTYARLTKTQFIQIITIFLRWLATICMVGIAIRAITSAEHPAKPNLASIKGFPRMFGICVYAFMCHHSIPAMLTPIDDKKYLQGALLLVFGLVLGCYYLITMTGIFAFEYIHDVYTLNFVMNQCKEAPNATVIENPAANVPVLNILLPSYPVFTIFSSYTVIALTLINNLRVVLSKYSVDADQPLLEFSYPLIAIMPPMVVSLFTEDVALVVSLVGAYTGSLLQYVFPSLLAYYSRQAVQYKYLEPHLQQMTVGTSETRQNKAEESTASPRAESVPMLSAEQFYYESNPFASPFRHRYWIFLTGIWWVFSVILVTIDQVLKQLDKKAKEEDE